MLRKVLRRRYRLVPAQTTQRCNSTHRERRGCPRASNSAKPRRACSARRRPRSTTTARRTRSFWNVLPTFHIAGIGVALLTGSLGGKSILYPEFEPAQVLAAIGKHRVTHAFLVPAMIQFLLAAPQIEGADLSSMQAISYGASPITERVLVDALRVFDCRFIQVYGLTETTGAVTALAAEDHATEGPKQVLLRSAGRAMDGVTIKIVDTATGQMPPDGEVGEVWIRTRQNMPHWPSRRRAPRCWSPMATAPRPGSGPATPATFETATFSCTTASRT
ncbi:MAG: AMP-binding protein [Burkholderiaceae bacterium]